MPGDLNLKKSWNPALLKNQKKVWEREQEALKEYQAIKEKAKEIASEREKEDMLRLQYGSDPSLLPSKHKLELNKLGWMYDGPKDQPKEDESGFREVQEDFLANTKEMQSLMYGEKAVKKTASRFDHVTSVGASKAGPSVLTDDPLLMIKQQKVKQKGGHMQDTRTSSRPSHEEHRVGDRDYREHKRGRERREGSGHRSHRSHRDDHIDHRSDHRSESHRSGSHRSERSEGDGESERRSGHRSHRERSDRDRSDRDRGHRDRSDRDRSYRDRGERARERSDRERNHGSRSHRDRSPDARERHRENQRSRE